MQNSLLRQGFVIRVSEMGGVDDPAEIAAQLSRPDIVLREQDVNRNDVTVLFEENNPADMDEVPMVVDDNNVEVPETSQRVSDNPLPSSNQNQTLQVSSLLSDLTLQQYSDLATILASPSSTEIHSSTLTESSLDRTQTGEDFAIRRGQRESHFVAEEPTGQKQFRSIEIQCSRPPFSFDYCKAKATEDEFKADTGLSPKCFEILYQFLGGDEVCMRLKYKYAKNTPKRERESEHTPRDKLFMTLLRLRLGLTLRNLRRCFHLSKATLSTIFYTWIRLMSLQFKTIEKEMFSSVERQMENPPDCFKPFPNLRTVVDCTSFKIQTPDNLQQQSNTYSSYHSQHEVKFLIGITTFGGCAFVSEGAEGSISDRKLFLKCGIMDHLNAREAVMVDKGFDIEAELNAIGVELIIPAFLGQRKEFTPRELMLNKAIGCSRIHVERFNKVLKDFALIRGQIPMTLVDILSDIVRVCCCLINFNEPFIRWTHNDGETDN